MAKKEFRTGLDAIFQSTGMDESSETKGRKIFVSDSNKEIRATFIVKEELLLKLKAIAYWERCQIKDIVDKAFLSVVSTYPSDKLIEIQKLFSESLK